MTTQSNEVTAAKQRFQIIGDSPLLLRAIDRALRVAPIDLSVLVTGESGSGKEFFPKIIHQFGARKHKKYIAVNCGAIPEGTIDSELFGHEKGSFTGAVSARKGYFEEADGGTIFLDEVAELPLTTQARLLRVLETGEFLKVGSSTVQKTDIRVVAATNVDLIEAVRQGRFREDLYYRLSTVVIDVPNLHDRGDDIILLARKFAADFAEKYVTSPITFSEEAKRALLLYRWPGNVRQLKNIIDQLALFEAGTEIERNTVLDLLPLHSDKGAHLPALPHPEGEAERQILWQMVLKLQEEVKALRAAIGREKDRPEAHHIPLHLDYADKKHSHSPLREPEEEVESVEAVEVGDLESAGRSAESQAIREALREADGDKKLTAERLNISLRTLYRKIKDLKIDE